MIGTAHSVERDGAGILPLMVQRLAAVLGACPYPLDEPLLAVAAVSRFEPALVDLSSRPTEHPSPTNLAVPL
jgi:hypothetical protein